MENEKQQNPETVVNSIGRVEMPAVVPHNENAHYSSLLIEDGIAQVTDHLKTIEEGMIEINQSAQKLNERMQQLQARKIALQAQGTLLNELKKKFEEFENVSKAG
jgi:uncharacterized phage infection (PIP) family protein YhgE